MYECAIVTPKILRIPDGEEALLEVPFLMPAVSTASTALAKAWRPSLLRPLEDIEDTCLSRAANEMIPDH